MCALYPSLSQNFGWSEYQPYQQCYIYGDNYETTSFLQREMPPNVARLDRSTSFTTDSGTDPTTVKKLNHNASERDRRKRINNMYSLLRSLLPASEQSKKLSIPATVSHVLKYIPEVQSQVERLMRRKEELLSKINSTIQDGGHNGHSHHEDHQNMLRSKSTAMKMTNLSTISINRINDREVVIQICTFQDQSFKAGDDDDGDSLAQLLVSLEEDGFLLLNASCFRSFGLMVFHNLHLQMDVTRRLDCDVLREKLSFLY